MRKATPQQKKRRCEKYVDDINALADAIGLYRTEDRETLKAWNALAEQAAVKGINTKTFSRRNAKTYTYR